MRQPLVTGNWKMHGSHAAVGQLLDGLLAAGSVAAEVAVCPPYPYLAETARRLKGSAIGLGAQDLCSEDIGAHTGEVSGAMLVDVGCRYVIVGHSERRALYGDTDALVAQKFVAAQRNGLVPILCVGETLDERQDGQMAEVVSRQLDAVLDVTGAAGLGKAVLAYEPVWAIGTGHTATPEQAQEVHALIRGRIATQDATIAASLRILYGGSVKGANAGELFAMPDVDGGLVGGASLKAEEFHQICRAAAG